MSERGERSKASSAVKPPAAAGAALKLSLIVAASENHVIGRDNDLPWRLSADLRRFKRLTMGHCLVMGRKTYESIGRPLPGRVSIVLSRSPSLREGLGEGEAVRGTEAAPVGSVQPSPNPSLQGRGVLAATSLAEARSLVPTTDMSHDEAFVTGGGEIYRLALPHADRVHLTRVHTTIDGDATFPELDPTEWRLVESERHAADEKNEFDYSFELWERNR